MRQRVFGNFALLAVFLCGCSTGFADISITVFPTAQTVALGSPVSVSLEIAGLGNLTAPSIGTFDLNLGFDPTLLSFSSASFGDPVLGDELDPTGMGNTINFTNPGIGTVELFDLSLDSATDLNNLQPAAFILGTLTFNSLGAGTSLLSLSVDALGDADGNPLTADLQGGDVSISSVPEPTSFLLLVTVTAAIQFWRSHRSRAKSRIM